MAEIKFAGKAKVIVLSFQSKDRNLIFDLRHPDALRTVW